MDMKFNKSFYKLIKNNKLVTIAVVMFILVAMKMYVVSLQYDSMSPNNHLFYNVLEHGENEFGNVWIYDNEDNRCMTFLPPGANKVQACMSLKHENQLIFDTYKLMMVAMYFQVEPRKVLHLGLGGGMLVRAVQVVDPKIEQHVVEINPLVVDYNKNYFKIQGSENIIIHTMDAIDFVRAADDKTYDMVWVDVFDDDYIPQQFLTHEFASELKRITKDSAVITVNTFSLSEEERKKHFRDGGSEDELFAKGFDHSLKLQSPTSLNQIIISIKGNLPMVADLISKSNILRVSFDEIGINQQILLPHLVKYIDKQVRL